MTARIPHLKTMINGINVTNTSALTYMNSFEAEIHVFESSHKLCIVYNIKPYKDNSNFKIALPFSHILNLIEPLSLSLLTSHNARCKWFGINCIEAHANQFYCVCEEVTIVPICNIWKWIFNQLHCTCTVYSTHTCTMFIYLYIKSQTIWLEWYTRGYGKELYICMPTEIVK